MVQFLTILSITFLLFVIVYFVFPDGTTYIHVTVSDRASVLAHDTMISFRNLTDDNGDYETSKGKLAT